MYTYIVGHVSVSNLQLHMFLKWVGVMMLPLVFSCSGGGGGGSSPCSECGETSVVTLLSGWIPHPIDTQWGSSLLPHRGALLCNGGSLLHQYCVIEGLCYIIVVYKYYKRPFLHQCYVIEGLCCIIITPPYFDKAMIALHTSQWGSSMRLMNTPFVN